MYERILLFNVSGLGDFIELVRFIEAIRAKYIDSSIVLVCSDKYYSYAKNCPYVNKILPWPVKKDKAFVLSRIIFYFSIVLKLRKYKFDLMINFNELGSLKSAFMVKYLTWFINPKITIGRNTNGLGEFYNLYVEDNFKLKKSENEYYKEIVKLIGVDQVNLYPNLWGRNVVDNLQ
ncbi:MAG: hypothetical protein SNJ64_03855, partial [Endomicrobiia bacterium]